MKISVIIPAYNEGDSVVDAYEAVVRMFRAEMPEHEYELIFVDDGSRDQTFSHLAQLAARDGRVVAIRLVRNGGAHLAVRAGLEHATGDAACFLPCDLQEPPELIPQLLRALAGPVQIVWAVRNSRQDPLGERVASRVFFAIARWFVPEFVAPSGVGIFLVGKAALRAIPLFRERNLTLDGLLFTMGFAQAYVGYERRARTHGRSRWTLAKRLKSFADFFAGYSYAPIRLMSYSGIAVASAGFLFGAFLVVNWLRARPVAGWTSLMLVLLLLGGLQMVMLGVMGEYVWRALDEARGRPRYIVETLLRSQTSEPEPETVPSRGAHEGA
jgi:dolichol-phosphate mannosyltransferase